MCSDSNYWTSSATHNYEGYWNSAMDCTDYGFKQVNIILIYNYEYKY